MKTLLIVVFLTFAMVLRASSAPGPGSWPGPIQWSPAAADKIYWTAEYGEYIVATGQLPDGCALYLNNLPLAADAQRRVRVVLSVRPPKGASDLVLRCADDDDWKYLVGYRWKKASPFFTLRISDTHSLPLTLKTSEKNIKRTDFLDLDVSAQAVDSNHDYAWGSLKKRAWRLGVAAGIGTLSLRQSGAQDASQSFLAIGASLIHRPAADWSAFASATVSALTLSSDVLEKNTRNFDASLGASHRMALASGWTLALKPNLVYQTFIGSQSMGFRNSYGPALGAAVDWHSTPRQSWQASLGAGLRNSDTSVVSASNHEVLAGLAYVYALSAESSLSEIGVKLEYRNLSVTYSNGIAEMSLFRALAVCAW